MMKKSLISILIFCFIAIICSQVFATNMVQDAGNTLNNIKDGVQNMAKDAGNTMGNVGNGISNMINNGENTVREGANDVGNAANDMTRSADDSVTGDGYTASRTSAELANGGTNTTTVWVVLAIAGILIIALVWYYGMQTQNTGRDHY